MKRTRFVVEKGSTKALPYRLINQTGIVGRSYCGSFKTEAAAQRRADSLNAATLTKGQLDDIRDGYAKEDL